MAKKRNPKKPSTNQIPTGSGQKSSQETKFTPEIPAVNSESVPQQGLPVNTEASTGQNSLVEPPYSAPAAVGASDLNTEPSPQQDIPATADASSGHEPLVEPPPSVPAATGASILENLNFQKSATATNKEDVHVPATQTRPENPTTVQNDGKVYRRKDQGSSLETTTPPTSNSFQLLDSVPETLSEPPQKSFAEVSAQQVNNSITLGSGNQVAALALQPVTSAKKISTVTAQDSTLVFNYDLSKGGLCVDLSSHLSSPANVSSEDDSANGYVSSSEIFSGEDDNSYDGNDNFIEVLVPDLS
ncbi:hypothetical protein Bca52824_071194 [Brassica carinata]|uniref:Uncharacterized protein n=1 Tax=Brassica carinata TaxID=52824 RepID=A0A8X7Q8K2_BRACI|nr:hypothetical protein Bca52824_071194 [Brassica carinata]